MPEETANVLMQDGPTIEVETEETETTATETTDAEPKAGEETDTKADTKEGEAQEHKKRLGGWQRKIAKLEQEVEVWRDQALRTQPAKDAKPEPESDKPTRPKLAEFTGTVEDYEKALEKYEADLEKWTNEKREQEAVAREIETSVASLTAKVSELEEFEEMRAAVKEHKMPIRLTNLLVQEAAKLKNGAETLKALLLDPDEAAQLAELDRYEDAMSIKAQVISMSRALRSAGKKSETAEGTEEKPAPAKPPAPISPVKKIAPTATGLSDDLPMDEWVRRREAQIRKK